MKNKEFSYNSCEKCGSQDSVENYQVEVASELSGNGQRLKLCYSCATQLKKYIYEYVFGWLKQDKSDKGGKVF